MLRTIVLVIACGFLAAAIFAVTQAPETWPMLIMAVLVVLGTVYERFYYRGTEHPAPGGNWQPTAERFLDEESGRPVVVWFNPATGERRYVDAGESPPTR